MNVELVPANQIDFGDYLRTFNEAYSDYFVPLQMQRDPMLRLIERDGVDMDASRVALVDQKPVGMGMLAIQEKAGWIGGLGVIPSQRGKGIGRLLTSALIDEARARQLEHVQLEVIEQNVRAYTLYESLGFQKVRRLLIVNRRAFITNLNSYPDLTIEEVFAEDAIQYYEKFHTKPNPWQRRYQALDALKDDMDGWIVYRESDPVGFAVGWIVADTIRLMDIATKDEEAGFALLEFIHNIAPMSDASLSNLAQDDPIWYVMEKMGYEEALAQFEMQIDL